MQYRMHPLIAEFPSARFYQGKLKTGITAEERPLPQGTPLTALPWISCFVYNLMCLLWEWMPLASCPAIILPGKSRL